MPNKPSQFNKAAERIGMKKQNNDGEWMEIIEYFNKDNISVRFDDGIIAKNRIYKDFQSGRIRHPNFFLRRIGEERIANNGQKMKIKEFFAENNITIQFEDNTFVFHKEYGIFLKGEIENPNYHVKTNMTLYEYVIKYYLEKYGFVKTRFQYIKEFADYTDKSTKSMEFDFFNSDAKIAIEFDGCTHNKKESIKSDFKKNMLCQNHGIALIRIRKDCGKMEDSSVDFIVENAGHTFSADAMEKALKESIAYINSIANLNIDTSFSVKLDLDDIRMKYMYEYKENRIGMARIMNNGLMATIKVYRNSHDIDVEFEDGVVVHHKWYKAFKRGEIGHPLIKVQKRKRELQKLTNVNFVEDTKII